MNHGQAGPRPITFDEALEQTASSRRLLLLGNGFSISARASFSYSTLFRSAGAFSPAVAALFSAHQTEDFEQVLSLLREKLQDASSGPAAQRAWKLAEEEVRNGFIRSVSTVHPDSSVFMTKEECERCATFLEHFVGRKRPLGLRGRIYTTNYDLLLYWVIARSGRRLWCYDSHISPVHDKRYAQWHPEKEPNLVYLHGALHLYDWGSGQGMLRYNGRLSLIEQTRTRLEAGRFPVIVSEGTSEAKAARIARSQYLTWGEGYLRSGLRYSDAVLFTFGHSLSERDAHLIRLVGGGRIGAVYVGAWGGLDGDQGPIIRHWTETWSDARRKRGKIAPPTVWVYDTSTFSPWR